MRRFYTFLSVPSALSLLLVAATFTACSEEKTPGEVADTTAAGVDSAAAAPDAATIAEMDRVVEEYVVAADSLAGLLRRLKTVKDAENAEAKIKEWSGTIRNFQAKSAQYGQPLVDRMTMPRVDSAITGLINAREELQKRGEVYMRVATIEGGSTQPAQ